MKINPTALTIAQLLGGQADQFVIPAYQRRYSWRTKHIAELFDDINQLGAGETHLLGSFVCLTKELRPGINELELVDGQQRMTTIMLFLNVIEEKYKSEGNIKEAEKLAAYLYCTDYNDRQENKLILGDLDRDDFDHIMANRNLGDVKNKQLLEGHELISRLINGLTLEELNIFRFKFINQANIIRLDVAEAKDAFKLFETINNRGLSLSPADIIKNFLLGNASLVDDATLERVKKNWTGLIVAMDGLNLDDFFRQYMNGLLGRKVNQSQLIDVFKKYFVENVLVGDKQSDRTEFSQDIVADELKANAVDDEEAAAPTDITFKTSRRPVPITKFVEDLRKSAVTYSQILNCNTGHGKIDRALANLLKIRSFPSYTFILNLLQRDFDEKDKLAILHMLETFMLRRNVSEYRTAELDDIFSSLTTVKNDNIQDTIKEILKDGLPSDNEFYEKLLQHDFRGRLESRAKYMLEQIEYDITGNTLEKYLGGGEDVHLEHIIPQTITTKKSKEEFGDWENYLGQEASALHWDYVAKLGNMTLLSAPLNIKASNNPFEAKKIEYAKSIIKLTNDLVSFSEFKFAQVDDRTEALAKQAVKIWSL